MLLQGAEARADFSFFGRPAAQQPVAEAAIRVLADDDYFEALRGAIRHAEKDILLVMYLFKANDRRGNRPMALVDELIAARKRGVTVRVLLDRNEREKKSQNVNRRAAERLQAAGITVHYDGGGRTTHVKAVVIDQHIVLVGSHNLTHAAMSSNSELSIMVDSPQLAAEIRRYLDSLSGTDID